MNRWLLIRRLRGPAFLILFGILALLNQWDVLSFRRSWPLYLILAGLLLLAERALLGAFPPTAPPYSPSYHPFNPLSGAPLDAPPVAPAADLSSPAPEDTASGGKWRA